jgi:UDP-3-O-[3-hydroxymyristoyl] N-acetylglucosamine deacetylase/3-hydroxyacyl-[acyl-carrier-protein] dehydratase
MPTAKRPQRTIARDAEVQGVSFLSGLDVRMRFHPAPTDHGVVFVRNDLPGRPRVPAHVRYVVPRQRRTTLQHGEAVVEMVEHVLAALGGLRIDNCLVEIDAAETPGCDGSSQAFAEPLSSAGIVEQDSAREVVAIDRPLLLREGAAALAAYPGADDRLVLSYHLDYGRDTPIGSQSRFIDLSPESFQADLAPSRTFLLRAEAEALRAAGIGTRTAETDLLIFDADGPVNNTLRFPDECVRHKLLDMVGDLALLGKDLAGHVVAHRSGHALNAQLVRALLDQVETSVLSHSAASALASLNIEEILKLLPHRYPFLLIDRVLELDAPRRVLGLKNVTYNEPFFQGHWPGRPIMPGVLILEALAQAAGVLIAQQFDPGLCSAVIAAIDGVRIRRTVVPGDQLLLEVEQVRSKLRTFEMKCAARVANQVAAEARIRFMVVEAVAAA